MTLFGFAGMAGMMMTGSGSGLIVRGAEGGAAALSSSTASIMTAGGPITIAAANQMAMSQATTADGSSGGGGDDGDGDDGDGGDAKDKEISERIRKSDRPSEKELNEFTDRLLRREGRNVQPNPHEGQPGAGRQGDRFVDGVKTEYKHPRPKPDGRPPDSITIKNNVTKSIRKGGQARDIIIDARGTGLTKAEAERSIRRAMHPDVSRGKVDNLRVIGDGFSVTN